MGFVQAILKKTRKLKKSPFEGHNASCANMFGARTLYRIQILYKKGNV